MNELKKLEDQLNGIRARKFDGMENVFKLGERNAKYTADGFNKLEKGLDSAKQLEKTGGKYTAKNADTYLDSANKWQEAKFLTDLQNRAAGGKITIPPDIAKGVPHPMQKTLKDLFGKKKIGSK